MNQNFTVWRQIFLKGARFSILPPDLSDCINRSSYVDKKKQNLGFLAPEVYLGF